MPVVESGLVKVFMNWSPLEVVADDPWYRGLHGLRHGLSDGPINSYRQSRLFMLALVASAVGKQPCPSYELYVRESILAGVVQAMTQQPLTLDWEKAGGDANVAWEEFQSTYSAWLSFDPNGIDPSFLRLVYQLFSYRDERVGDGYGGSSWVESSEFDEYWEEQKFCDAPIDETYGNIRKRVLDWGEVAIQTFPVNVRNSIHMVAPYAQNYLDQAIKYKIEEHGRRYLY